MGQGSPSGRGARCRSRAGTSRLSAPGGSPGWRPSPCTRPAPGSCQTALPQTPCGEGSLGKHWENPEHCFCVRSAAALLLLQVFGRLRVVGAPGCNSRLPVRIFGRGCDTNPAGTQPCLRLLCTGGDALQGFCSLLNLQFSSAQSSSPAADTAPIPFLETLRGTALIRNTSVSALLNCEEFICINDPSHGSGSCCWNGDGPRCPKERRGRFWGCLRDPPGAQGAGDEIPHIPLLLPPPSVGISPRKGSATHSCMTR